MKGLSVMLPTMVWFFTSANWSFIISLTSCIGVSAWSMSVISAGLYIATCFTISEPMDPAAPVMSTLLPLSISPMAFMSTSIFSRGSRSSISISRSWL